MARAKDPARKWTDKELKEMERHIGGIYDQALKEITEKWDAYMERTEKRLGNLYAAYVSAPEDKKADALEKYQKALENATYKNEWYREMVKETATRLTKVNEIATAYINGKMPEIYKVNYDQIDPDALIPGIKYTMVDEHTVSNLIKNGTIPQKKVDEDNDASWNTKQIGSAVLQGILQGESIPNIAKRIMPIVGRNEASAVRNARTMTTAAENRGRLDRYDDYESKGLIMGKVWIATGDDRTRDWHLSLDGQEVDKDEPFIDGNGNELQYPGDPDAAPETVWNCRCSMRSHITGVRGKSGKITPIADMHKKGLHQEQIEGERKRRGMETKPTVPQAPIISFTPAATIEEAEHFARDTFINGGFNLTGKDISYKGVDISIANKINERLNEIYTQYQINGLASLEAYGKGNKKVFSRNPDAPFFTTNFGNIGMNTTLMKTEAMVKAYQTEGENAFKYVIDNMGMLSGKQLEIAKAYEFAGRSLVDNSIEGMITHEIGHHLSYMPEINKALSAVQNTDWEEYARHLSGYANHSFGEYVAESWTAYYNGETNLVQPELVKIFEGLKKW